MGCKEFLSLRPASIRVVYASVQMPQRGWLVQFDPLAGNATCADMEDRCQVRRSSEELLRVSAQVIATGTAGPAGR